MWVNESRPPLGAANPYTSQKSRSQRKKRALEGGSQEKNVRARREAIKSVFPVSMCIGPVLQNVTWSGRLVNLSLLFTKPMAYVLGGENTPHFASPLKLRILVAGRTVTFLVFQQGPVIITGVKNNLDAINAMLVLVGWLYRRYGVICFPVDLQVQNIMSTLYMSRKIDTDRLANGVLNCEYLPKNIPYCGLTLRRNDRVVEGGATPIVRDETFDAGGDLVCLVYRSGNIVFTGTSEYNVMKNRVKDIQRLLRPYFCEEPSERFRPDEIEEFKEKFAVDTSMVKMLGK